MTDARKYVIMKMQNALKSLSEENHKIIKQFIAFKNATER